MYQIKLEVSVSEIENSWKRPRGDAEVYADFIEIDDASALGEMFPAILKTAKAKYLRKLAEETAKEAKGE